MFYFFPIFVGIRHKIKNWISERLKTLKTGLCNLCEPPESHHWLYHCHTYANALDFRMKQKTGS